jgi:hypothetical protein
MSSFGTVMYSLDCLSWVNDLGWSASGELLTAVAHNSQLYTVAVQSCTQFTHKRSQWRGNPLFCLCYGPGADLYAGGFDRVPVRYVVRDSECCDQLVLDEAIAQSKQQTLMSQAKGVFEVKKLGAAGEDIEYMQKFTTKHKNTIVYPISCLS